MRRRTTTVTTTTTDRGSRWRLPLGGAAIVASVVMASCTAATAPTESPVVDTTPRSSTTATVPTTTTTATVPAVDAAMALTTGLAALDDGYRFETTVTVGDSTIAQVAGLVLGDNAQLEITSGDATLTYVVTPSERWVRVENGEWELLTDEDPPARPLDELRDPTSVELVEASGATVVVDARYPASRFGGGDGEVTMRMTITDGSLAQAGYQLDGEPPAAVLTTFQPASPDAVIESPTG